jgi:hypothetical protein
MVGSGMSEEPTMAEIGRTMMRLEQKLDRTVDDHEGRLRHLERAVWIATGLGGAAMASAMGTLFQVLAR